MKSFLKICLGVASFAAIATASSPSIADEDKRDNEAVQCLAMNIYFEARGSNLADKAAVADVVLNRVQDSRYPSTVCGVVHQGKRYQNGQMVRNRCQFSWYCDGRADKPRDKDRWGEAILIAYQMYHYDKYRGITEGATHYHANYVNPRWARKFQQVGRIGAHIYYRQP